jgi:hypothetical protein
VSDKVSAYRFFAAQPGAVEDQQLIFDEDGLGNYGTDGTGTRKSGDGREEMDEQDHEIAHFRILAGNRKLAKFWAN